MHGFILYIDIICLYIYIYITYVCACRNPTDPRFGTLDSYENFRIGFRVQERDEMKIPKKGTPDKPGSKLL